MTSLQNSVSNFLSTVENQVHQYKFTWQNKEFKIAYETQGKGDPVLLLPAFSTVSTREEMAGVAKILASKFQTISLDWLGFGDSQRSSLDYNPAIYYQLLADFIQSIFDKPITIIAAGHASGYALKFAANYSELVSKIVLVAPTWQGPFRVMGASEKIRYIIKEMVQSPIIGQLLYSLNTMPWFLKFMYKRHVYVNQSLLTSEFIYHKWQITQKQGARFAPAAFVTGHLDPVNSRSEYLGYFKSISIPVLNIISQNAPPASKGEMEEISKLPEIKTVELSGSLGIHEEKSQDVADAILSFLV